MIRNARCSRSARWVGSLVGVAMTALCLVCAATGQTDRDQDGMNDEYETFYGLNATNRHDAKANYDEDLLENLSESLLWTDPFAGDTDLDGWLDHEDDSPVSRCVLDWGSPFFSEGDYLNAWGPEWFVDAYKIGGVWNTNAGSWFASVPGDSLCIELARNALSNDLRLVVGYELVSGTSLDVYLYDTNGTRLSVYSHRMACDVVEENPEQTLSLPLEHNEQATVVVLAARTGRERVDYSLLYVDQDGDSLDADQETQLGTSDLIGNSPPPTRCPSDGSATPSVAPATDTLQAHRFAHAETSATRRTGRQVSSGRRAKQFRVYVNQLVGRDAFSGKSRSRRNGDGPKQTITGGLRVIRGRGELIVEEGVYKEDLSVTGRSVRVKINGRVRLD